MQLDQLVRIINREPKSFVGAFVLDSTLKTVSDVERECVGLLGFDTVVALKKEHPGLSSTSIQSYFDYSFAPIVEGDKSQGYRIKDTEVNIQRALMLALKYSSLTGLSMYDIFRIDQSAAVVANVIENLYQDSDLRIQDLHEKVGSNWTSITNHVLRLEKIGLTRFERYEGGVQFQWNNQKNLDNLETDVKKKLKDLPLYRRHTIHRAIEVGVSLHQNRERPMNSVEITNGIKYSKSKSSIHFTEHGLRILVDLGYVIPSNDFRGGERQSKVNITLLGRGFNLFLKQIENYDSLPDTNLSLEDATHSLNLYNKANGKRKSADARMRQVQNLLKSEPGLTRREVDEKIGTHCSEYLSTLHRRGILEVTGTGRINDLFKYS